MSSFFFTLGRSLGHATIPAIRKSKAVWQTFAGNEAEAIRSEIEFGRAMTAEFRLKVRVSDCTEDQDRVRAILQRLSGRVRNKLRAFTGVVFAEEVPTAVALPGGFIFLSSGLLGFCRRDDDQLAFVIGHEMGHIIRSHALDRVRAQIGTEGLSAVLSRGLLNPSLRAPELGWLQLAHTHVAELEADEFGVRVAAGSYNATGAIKFLEQCSLLRQTTDQTSDYLLSHPAEEERIENIHRVLRGTSTQGQIPSR